MADALFAITDTSTSVTPVMYAVLAVFQLMQEQEVVHSEARLMGRNICPWLLLGLASFKWLASRRFAVIPGAKTLLCCAPLHTASPYAETAGSQRTSHERHDLTFRKSCLVVDHIKRRLIAPRKLDNLAFMFWSL